MVALSDARPGLGTIESGNPSGVSWAGGVVRFRDRRLFADPSGEPCRDFLRRMFRLEEVQTVEIDPAIGQAMVRHALGDREIDRVLGRMSSTLRAAPDPGRERPCGGPPRLRPLPADRPGQPVRLNPLQLGGRPRDPRPAPGPPRGAPQDWPAR